MIHIQIRMTMTRPYIIITLAALPLMFSSCIKDEPLGMECDIEEASYMPTTHRQCSSNRPTR